MGLIDLLLGDDDLDFARTISPSSPASPRSGDDGEDRATFRAQVSEIKKISTDVGPSFPHCPRCLSYALYRPNNVGDYECQTCGLEGIREAVAGRTQ